MADRVWFSEQASQEHLSHEIHEISRKEARELSFVTSRAMTMKGMKKHEECARGSVLTLQSFVPFVYSVASSLLI